MFSGVKFIPRDQIHKAINEDTSDSPRDRKRSGDRNDKHKLKKKTFRNSSSDEENHGRIEKRSRRKKWYALDESSSHSSGSEDDEVFDQDHAKLEKNKKKKKKSTDNKLGDKNGKSSRNKSRNHKKRYGSDEYSSTSDVGDGDNAVDGSRSPSNMNIVRKEVGLEWMLQPGDKRDSGHEKVVDELPEQALKDDVKKANPKELNPYLKNDGNGYPEGTNRSDDGGGELLRSSVVGDAGASWRYKALKRAQEQAAREGRRLEEVVGERWGSLSELTASIVSQPAAPSHAHLHAIKSRIRGSGDEQPTYLDNDRKRSGKDYLKNVPPRHPGFKEPKAQFSSSWGKRRSQKMNDGVISAAASSLNKFANDGSFLNDILHQQAPDNDSNVAGSVSSEGLVSPEADKSTNSPKLVKDAMSVNQLAAKALQLRMKGKHEEAEKLENEAAKMKSSKIDHGSSMRRINDGNVNRGHVQETSLKERGREEDADKYLANVIMHNKRYSISSQADDEYDYGEGTDTKSRKKHGSDDKRKTQNNTRVKHIITQQERCLFCLENPKRPMHLVVSVANFTYLMLPQWQSVVPGHCCILPIQHESATRTVDDDVWTEIRNFKKCLIMMFANQEKEVVFLETVMGLAQQRRHCMIECIPLAREIAKEAPLYFKKAIDEAEDEWSQHNAKKLIDTSEKGLRNSIPKHFPYFHVEFGLNRGFVHVIDDEKQFKSNLGLNVVRGMLQLPEEDMYRRRQSESKEVQKQAVAQFSRDWEPFDWTKQLHEVS